MSNHVSRWDDVRADWRFTAGLFFVTVLLETAAFGQLTAFTPLYLRQVIGMSEEQVPFWTGVLVATSLAVAVPLAPWWGVLADRYSRKPYRPKHGCRWDWLCHRGRRDQPVARDPAPHGPGALIRKHRHRVHRSIACHSRSTRGQGHRNYPGRCPYRNKRGTA